MAAPSLISGYSLKDSITGLTPIAPLINSASIVNTLRSRYGGIQAARSATSAAAGDRYGARVVLTAPVDLDVHKYLVMQHGNEFANEYRQVSDVYFLFEDGSGNWIEFLVKESSSNAVGLNVRNASLLQSYNRQNIGAGSQLNYSRMLNHKSLTPTSFSGTIDWTDIVAVEWHYVKQGTANNLGSAGIIGYLCGADQNILINGDFSDKGTFQDFSNLVYTVDSNHFYEWYSPSTEFAAVGGNVYVPWLDWGIGDGSTPTEFQDSNAAISFFGDHDGTDFECWGPQLSGTIRQVTINQSPSDIVEMTDVAIRSRLKDFAFSLIGNTSGTANFTRLILDTFESATLGHGTYNSPTLANYSNSVNVTTDTIITSGVIRGGDATSLGLKAVGAAGDYTGIDVTLSDNLQYDLTLGSGGAGSYDFSNINVPSGYTLKIRNDSATNAVTVLLPSGLTTSSSTEGGTITIQSAPTTYTLAFPNIIDGSRFQIYNITQDTELSNALVSGGSGISEIFIADTDFMAGDVGRYRIAFQDGLNCKKGIEGTFTFQGTTTTNSIPITQVDDTVYTSAGVDGSLVSEFSWDSGNVQVDINDSDNTTTIQRLGAWFCHFSTTVVGIEEAFGAITWPGVNSIQMNTSVVDILLDNIKLSPLLVTGGRIFRDDETSIIAPLSNSIQIDYSPVYTIGGLTQQTVRDAMLLAPTPGEVVESGSIDDRQNTINEGVQDASLLIPHDEDL